MEKRENYARIFLHSDVNEYNWNETAYSAGSSILCNWEGFAFGHHIAKFCDMLSVVGSNLTINFSNTTNKSQHVATGWPNPRYMLRPTMLGYDGLTCCNRLAGAFNRHQHYT